MHGMNSEELELLCESKLVKPARLSALVEETNQLIAILTATVLTAKRRTARNNLKS